MRFSSLAIPEIKLIQFDQVKDERGSFSRVFSVAEFAEQKLCSHFDYAALSFNHKKGSFRGLHFQAEPFGEIKLVRCSRGAIVDIVVDGRPESPSFAQSVMVELRADTGQALYIPKGFAHGFQTLLDESEVHYMIAGVYSAEHARGLRVDDPRLGIQLPLPISVIAEKDRQFPLLALAK